MELRSLTIEQARWGDRKGEYVAKITVGDDGSSITMTVDKTDTDRILKTAMGALLTAVDRSAAELRERLIASVNHVPHLLTE